MKKLFRKLECRLFGHQWFGGSFDQSLQCVRCKEHRPWMNLDVAYACNWLNDKPEPVWETPSEIKKFGGYSTSDLDDVLDRYGLTREDLKCDHTDAFDTSFTAPLYYYDYCPYCGEKLAETECDHKDVDGRSYWLPVYSGGLSYTYCRKCGEKK